MGGLFDLAGRVARPGEIKGAAFSLVSSLGTSYAADGVFVNGVEPCRVLTPKDRPDNPGGVSCGSAKPTVYPT